MPTPTRRSFQSRALLTGGLLAGALVLAACTANLPTYMSTTTSSAAIGPAALAQAAAKLRDAGGAALVAGAAMGPAGVVGANIVANNSSRIIGENSSGVVANNTSRFGLLGIHQNPIANAIVYLTDADERFYAAKGQPVTATTGTDGRYSFASGLPTGQEIIVNVILADNRREVGFTVSQAGKNDVNVSLATNYVTEFLRERSHGLGRAMSSYDLSQLSNLTRLTQDALDHGDLAVPDLNIGHITNLDQAYGLVVGLNKQGLGDAWAKLLGERVLAMTTIAGSGESGYGGDGGDATKAQLYKPKGLARDSQGNLYIVEEGNDSVRKVTPDGKISTFAGVGSSQFSGDGGPAKAAGLNWPRTALMGPGDVLYISDVLNERIRRVDLHVGTISTFAGDPVQAGGAWLDDFFGDGGPATKARFAGVRGMAWDNEGRMAFSDTWDNSGGVWHHIRRIEKDGTITTLVGVDDKHGFNGDGLPGRETLIDYVQQIAFDAQDNLYFADNRNQRVRKLDAKTNKVSTVAGDGTEGTRGEGVAATSAQLSSPYGVAVDTKGRLFIAERGGKRIRVVLPDGTIHSLAGGGTFTGDGEARDVALTEPHDLLLEPDGNLLFCDARAARVRRLWLKWGF